MKRIFLPAAAAIAIALFAVNLHAQESDASKTKGDTSKISVVTPDWHYRWHDGRWWYWMSENNENRWMVWTGSRWIPYEQFANCPNMFNVSQARSYSTAYGSYEAQNESGTSQPVDWGGGNYRPTWSTGSGGNYAGYGWSWGPGTAYRDAPGRRF